MTDFSLQGLPRGLWVGLCVVALAPRARAVDGISVTSHWSGNYDGFYGGYGSVWRHDIADNVVVRHLQLHPGPARNVVISPDGTRVAFLLDTGAVAVMSVDGGAATELAQSHGEACLDWPQGNWLYYNLGGWDQPATSSELRRVDVTTGEDQLVVNFSCSIWRFHISADLRRAIVRDTADFGAIVTYDMTAGDGILYGDNATDAPSCSEGLDPLGVYFIDGWPDHHGIDFRRWTDLEIVQSLAHADATLWGGRESGVEHDRNFWSSNSQKWLCIHLGWGIGWDPINGWGTPTGANQVLYNWIDQQRIVVTDNVEGSEIYDSAGDFWIRPVAAPDGGGFDAARTDGGSTDRAGLDAAAGEGANRPPLVNAGADQQVNVGGALLLDGTVDDDGRVFGVPQLSWSQLSGPGSATIDSPNSARTLAHFDQAGSYLLRLTANDGEYSVSDEVSVEAAIPSLQLLSPLGGESWVVGESYEIQWQAVLVDDVTLSYSIDDGATWEMLAFTVDRQDAEWGSYSWQIPATPSDRCRVLIAPYGGGGIEARSAPFTIRRPRLSDAGTAHEVKLAHGCECAQSGSAASALAGGFITLWLAGRRWRRITAPATGGRSSRRPCRR